MNGEDFKTKFKDTINQHVTKIVEGQLSSNSDISKADFNGVYALLDNNEVIYIGSAYSSKFKVKNRLYIHRNAHPSNACLAKQMMRERNWTREQVQQYMNTLDFIAFEHFSLEYYLIENCSGLINKKGYNNNH